MNPMKVVFDADGLIAFFDEEDYHHKRTKALAQKLFQEKAICLIPVTAVCEAITMFQKGKKKQLENGKWQWERRPKPHLAEILVSKFQTRSIRLHMLDEAIIMEAFRLYSPKTSSDTIYDAIVAAAANCKNLDAIFSFDHWYRDQGFKLINDLLSDR